MRFPNLVISGRKTPNGVLKDQVFAIPRINPGVMHRIRLQRKGLAENTKSRKIQLSLIIKASRSGLKISFRFSMMKSLQKSSVCEAIHPHAKKQRKTMQG